MAFCWTYIANERWFYFWDDRGYEDRTFALLSTRLRPGRAPYLVINLVGQAPVAGESSCRVTIGRIRVAPA